MTRAPVLFRVDAGPRPGWEGLWRCVTFAAALQRRRRTAFFLSQLEPATLAQNVKRGGNEWVAASARVGAEGDLDELIAQVRRVGPAAVVVDSPEATEPYLAALRD